jgi:PAS domain S-box-containing protein
MTVVLVIDTDGKRRETIQQALTDYTLHFANGMTEASRLLNTVVPRVILCDGDRVDADQIAVFRQKLPSVQVVVFTRNNDTQIDRFYDAGVDDCVRKPFPARLLRHRVQALTQQDTLTTDRYLFDAGNDAVFITDILTGDILDANQTATRWLGYSRDELLGLRQFDLEIPMEHGTETETIIREVSTTGHFIYEQNYRTRTGEIVPAEVSTRFLLYAGRRAMLSFVRDISRRKDIESSEIEQRRFSRILRETVASLTNTLDLDRVVRRVLDHVVKVLPADGANVMLINDKDEISIVGYVGSEMYAPLVGETWPLESFHNLNQIAQTGQPLVVQDTRSDPNWLRFEGSGWIGSQVSAPLMAEDRVIGFVNVDHGQENIYTDSHADTLKVFALQAGIAVQNARLHQSAKRHAEELEEAVALRTAELSQANHDLKEQILERRRAEARLDDERNLLRTLINNLPDDVFIKDGEGYIVTANRHLLERLGTTTEENLGLGAEMALFPPGVAAHLRGLERRVLDHDEVIRDEEIVIQQGDAPRWLLVTRMPLENQYGAVVGMVGINRDITTLRRTDEALNRERNLLRTLIDNIPDEVYAKDTDGTIILSNRAHSERVQHRAPDGGVIGSDNYDYMDDDIADDRREFEHDLIYNQRQAVTREIKVNIRDGAVTEREWVLATQAPIYDDDDDPIGLVGINRDVTMIKRVQEQLREVIHGAYCILWEADARPDPDKDDQMTVWDMRVIDEDAAHNFLPLAGYPEVSYAEAWQAAMLPGEFDFIKHQSDTAIFAGRSAYHVEFRCHRADGSVRWLREEVKINRQADDLWHLVGVTTDITERKQAEFTLQRANDLLEQRVKSRTVELERSNKVLREQIEERQRAEQAERQQRKLAETLRDSALAMSESLKLNDVLDRLINAARRILPAHVSDIISVIEDDIYVNAIRYHHKDEDGQILIGKAEGRDYIETLPIFTQVRAEARPVVIADVTADERWMTVEHSEWVRSFMCVPITAEGRVIGFLSSAGNEPGTFNEGHAHTMMAFSSQAGVAMQNARLFEMVQRQADDLRERVAERTRQLELERAQLRAILDAMIEGVTYSTPNAQIAYVNPAMIRMTGYEADEWQAADIWQEIYAGDKLDWQAYSDSVTARLMRQGVCKGETRIRRKNGEVFDASVVSVLVHGRGADGAGAVTVLRDISAEKRLEAQKARFIATASHELRTPITNLKTRLYLIRRRPDTINQHLDVMANVTDRMSALVEDLLDVSRFENGIFRLDKETFQLHELLEQVVELQSAEADKQDLTLTFYDEAASRSIYADRNRLMQVFINLVVNALNYTPAGGEVTLTLRDDQRDEQVFYVASVQDTGIGIPENLQAEIFKPFFRANDYNPGVGLGLSITKEIIEAHDGLITVSSQEGQGTRFEVWLPLTAVEA